MNRSRTMRFRLAACAALLPAIVSSSLPAFAAPPSDTPVSVRKIATFINNQTSGSEIPIQNRPVISGDIIVWKNLESQYVTDLFFYDLRTGQQKQITSGKAVYSFAVSGNTIVWSEQIIGGGSPGYQLFSYEIGAGITTRHTADRADVTRSWFSFFPRTLGTVEGSNQIALYDLDTQQPVRVTVTNPGIGAAMPRLIGGNALVYSASPSTLTGPRKNFARDLGTGDEQQIFEVGYYSGLTQTDGFRVVYNDSRNGELADVYVYDPSTNVETRLTSHPAGQVNPTISGNRIVWADYRAGAPDIYLFNLATGIETPIANTSATEIHPFINGNRIAYINQNENAIYLAELPPSPEPNHAPVFRPLPMKTAVAGQQRTFIVKADDPEGSAVTLAASGLPAGATFNAATGEVRFTPTSAQVGSSLATFSATDTNGFTAYLPLRISVVAQNRPPVFDPIPDTYRSQTAGKPLTFRIVAFDPDGDDRTYNAGNLPNGATFDPVTRTFTWTATLAQAGTPSHPKKYTVTFTTKDSGGLSSTISHAISIYRPN